MGAVVYVFQALTAAMLAVLGGIWSVVRAAVNVNGIGIVATLIYLAWMWYYFIYTGTRVEPPSHLTGMFTPELVWKNLAHFGVIYLTIEYVSAALAATNAGASTRTRMFGWINVGVTVLPLILSAVLLSNSSGYNITGDKLAQLWWSLQLSIQDFVGTLALTLLVASRMFGFGSSSSPQT